MAEYKLQHTGAELDEAIGKVQAGYTDTSGATAAAAEILAGKTAGVRGQVITGTMPDMTGDVVNCPDARQQQQDLYISGAGTATKQAFNNTTDFRCAGSVVAQAIDLTADKIKQNETILGITGTYAGKTDPSQGCTATAGDVRDGKTFAAGGESLTGTLPAANSVQASSVQEVSPMIIFNLAGETIVGSNIYANKATVANAIGLTADKIKKGEVILGITGTYEGTDTSDATATAADIRSGKTAYVNGQKVTGTLPYVNALTSSSVTPYATGNYIAYTTRADDAIYASKSILIGSQAQVAAAGGVTSAKLVNGQTAFGLTGTGRSWPLCWATGDPGYGDGVPQTWRGEIKINAPYCELNSFVELCRLALIDVGLVTPGGNANAALLNIKTTYDTLKQSYIRLFITKEASN